MPLISLPIIRISISRLYRRDRQGSTREYRMYCNVQRAGIKGTGTSLETRRTVTLSAPKAIKKVILIKKKKYTRQNFPAKTLPLFWQIITRERITLICWYASARSLHTINADCTRRRPRTPLSTGRLSQERAHSEILTRVLFFQLCVTEAGKSVSACITFANFVNLTFTYIKPSSKEDYRSIRMLRSHNSIQLVSLMFIFFRIRNMHKYYHDEILSDQKNLDSSSVFNMQYKTHAILDKLTVT